MLEQILQYDTDLFLLLNNLGTPSWDRFWLIVTDEFTFVPLYAILLFLIYKKLGWKVLLLLVFVIAAMITFTDQITNLFKDGFERKRPCRADDIIDQVRFIAVRCGKYGFFSGHSSNSMAAAVFAGLLLKPYFKYLIFILLFWSAIVAYSRIYVGVHYPLDIFFGMTFGALAGFMFYKLQILLRKRFIS
ncbi:MAG: phosphatase PAP2 family protein [Bacteroidia bacterium]|nr:phosphatase PAP2 family protein [Bacteroidia bacterium]NND26555.1 phosphatase PAP2 family protein [Flavobacteriaceae bacterium]MBT8278365.1 phosphatase PAP2 family protein [Bacteroidia bacterium]NNK60112.1 phosphatase PAP2 family protein [Flavobacteriaceae bacterium]NNL32141.1 phosphatase PAP2 family protein [Flavobacteriaceae bacterium]